MTELKLSPGSVRALPSRRGRPAPKAPPAVANASFAAPAETRPLAQLRGYAREDLLAIAEIGYEYLFNGGPRLAIALFDGLTAIAPDEPYFCLALGLAHDHHGDRSEAERWYARAADLDPGDARADVNRAELRLAAGDITAALRLLKGARAKASDRGDRALERKARALVAHLERTSTRG
jgi:Flp pilus assembly protein TadD